MTYGFQKQATIGTRGARVAASWLSKRGPIRWATEAEEWSGVDLWVGDVSVEVKTCLRAHDTGNIAMEAWSNEESERAGWLFTCEADWLLYQIPLKFGEGLWFRPDALREAAVIWRGMVERGEMKTARIPNKGYHSVVWLVPRKALGDVLDRSVWVPGLLKEFSPVMRPPLRP